nr:uncharacterized protein LOC127308441 [Lolium perenne]
MSPDLCPFPPSRASIPSFSIPLAGGASQFPASRGPVVSRRDHLPRPRASIPSIFHPSRGFSASRGFRWPAAPGSSLDPLVPVAGGAPQFTESRGFRWRPAASPHLPVLFSRRKASPDLDFTEKSKAPSICADLVSWSAMGTMRGVIMTRPLEGVFQSCTSVDMGSVRVRQEHWKGVLQALQEPKWTVPLARSSLHLP